MGKQKVKSVPQKNKPTRESKKPKQELGEKFDSTQSGQDGAGLVLANKLLPTGIPLLAVRPHPFFPG